MSLSQKIADKMAAIEDDRSSLSKAVQSWDCKVSELVGLVKTLQTDGIERQKQSSDELKEQCDKMNVKLDQIKSMIEEERMFNRAERVKADYVIQRIPTPDKGNDIIKRDIEKYFSPNLGYKIVTSANKDNISIFINMLEGTTFRQMLDKVLVWKDTDVHLRKVSLDNAIPAGMSAALKSLKQTMSVRDNRNNMVEGRPAPYTVITNTYKKKLIVTIVRRSKVIGYIFGEKIEEERYRNALAIQPNGTWISKDESMDIDGAEGAGPSSSNLTPAGERTDRERIERIQAIAAGTAQGEGQRAGDRNKDQRTNRGTEMGRAKAGANNIASAVRENEKTSKERNTIHEWYNKIREAYPNIQANWKDEARVKKVADQLLAYSGGATSEEIIKLIKQGMEAKTILKENYMLQEAIELLVSMEKMRIEMEGFGIPVDADESPDDAWRTARGIATIRAYTCVMAKAAYNVIATSPFGGAAKFQWRWNELRRTIQYIQGKWSENCRNHGWDVTQSPQEYELGTEIGKLSCQTTEGMHNRYISCILSGDYTDNMNHVFDDIEYHCILLNGELQHLYNSYLAKGSIRKHPGHITQPEQMDDEEIQDLLREELGEEEKDELMDHEPGNAKRVRSEEGTPTKPRKTRAITTPYVVSDSNTNLSVARTPETVSPKPQRSKKNLIKDFGESIRPTNLNLTTNDDEEPRAVGNANEMNDEREGLGIPAGTEVRDAAIAATGDGEGQRGAKGAKISKPAPTLLGQLISKKK